jgi:hypothetical protein
MWTKDPDSAKNLSTKACHHSMLLFVPLKFPICSTKFSNFSVPWPEETVCACCCFIIAI